MPLMLAWTWIAYKRVERTRRAEEELPVFVAGQTILGPYVSRPAQLRADLGGQLIERLGPLLDRRTHERTARHRT